MTWFFRFCLGLPARPSDVRDIQTSLPELLDESWVPPDDFNRRYLLLHPFLEYPSPKLIDDIRAWAKHPDSQESYHRRISPDNCPAANCPLRAEKESDPVAGDVIHLMKAGGGPGRKPPLDEFLDLVRIVHKDARAEDIRQVILTDRYIYSDVSEDAMPGGYRNLVKYLSALGLRGDSAFELVLNPNPRYFTIEKQEIFKRYIRSKFTDITFNTFSPRYDFHDRFYLVRNSRGTLDGVFGPSINGLSSEAIALVGQIDRKWALDRLDQWL